ncbi:hypothetical protein [Bizionia sp.]|uniref:hypothetical protein n=1 Tax=Bizionia sp. TaxID=1954480 RepID=UPI003A8E3A99
MNKTKNTTINDIYTISFTSLGKCLRFLKNSLDKKEHKVILLLIAEVKKDQDRKLYEWLRRNTIRNKENKYTPNSLLKSLNLLAKKSNLLKTINKEFYSQNSIRQISYTSIRKCLKFLKNGLDENEHKDIHILITKVEEDQDRKLNKWLLKKTIRNKENKFTPKNLLKSLILLNKKLKKNNIKGALKSKLQKTTIKESNSQNSVKQISEADCEKIYFTWKNLIFTPRGVKVDPNIIYLPKEIDGPTNLLNNINVSYFQKKYSDDLYKVYVDRATKKIIYNLSNDIDKIRIIVLNHINNHKDLQIKSYLHQEIPNKKIKENYTISKEININEIGELYKNNIFIKQASKLLKNDNKAVSLWENNNSTFEEALLIILKNRNYNFVIWENINQNRACYIFKYKNVNFDKKFKALKKFINSDLEYKRWDLFNNNNGNHSQLNYKEYYTVVHESVDSYKKKLNIYLKPHFRIK